MLLIFYVIYCEGLCPKEPFLLLTNVYVSYVTFVNTTENELKSTELISGYRYIYRPVDGQYHHAPNCHCDLFHWWQTHDLGEHWPSLGSMMTKTAPRITPATPYGAIWEQFIYWYHYLSNSSHQYHHDVFTAHSNPNSAIVTIIITLLMANKMSCSAINHFLHRRHLHHLQHQHENYQQNDHYHLHSHRHYHHQKHLD